jgi:TolB-like protein
MVLVASMSESAHAVALQEGIERLAAQLADGIPDGRVMRIAVVDFPDLQGITSDLGRFIGERLTTRLSAQTRKFRVVERRRLGQVLVELKFGMSDLVDPAKAQQLGRLLGVEGIVVGTISDLGNSLEVDARVIEIETSTVLPGRTVAITKDETVRQLLDRGAQIAAPGSGAIDGVAPRRIGALRHQDLPKVRVEVEGLQTRQDGSVLVILAYTNKTRVPLKLALRDAGGWGNPAQADTHLADDVGNNYVLASAVGIPARRSNQSDYENWLSVEAASRATASLIFIPSLGHERRRGAKLFSLTSAQILHDRDVSSFAIAVREIEPR